MRKILFFSFLFLFSVAAHTQYNLKGRITDFETTKPLTGATVALKGTGLIAITNNEGYYAFSNLQVRNVVLVTSYVGYETVELAVAVSNATLATTADVSMKPVYKTGEDIVVSASKRPEKITDAPASIQVISKKDIEQFTGSNTFELLSKVQGVEFTRTSIDHSSINARGMNNAFNNKVFQIVDGRNSMTALSGSLAMHNNFSLVKDDIERIEVVLGPQTALYGPNAHNAVISFITKDPRTSQGTTVSLSAGNQYQFSGRIRQATKINNKWAYKFAGEYAVGEEFKFYDSVYAGGTVYGPPVAIPEKNNDFGFRHIRGEAHVYYSVMPKADIIISIGGSNNNTLNTHTGGHLRFKGVTNSFLQTRFVSPHFYVNIYNAWANFGNSFQLGGYTRDFWNRTHSTITDTRDSLRRRLPPDTAEIFAMRYGNRVKETPQRFNAEAQYNYKFEKTGLFLVSSFSYQKDKPRGYGITLVDSFQRIYVTQVGAVVQLEKTLPWKLRIIGAGRWDNHSNFGNFFSPKFGLVKQAGDGNFRITWGRAYSMPSVLYQYASTGGSFFGNGEGITFIPTGTKMSDKVRRTTTPLKPEQVNTWEFGYKGTVVKKLYIDINYFTGVSKNFFSPSISVRGRVLNAGDKRVTHNPAFAGQVGNDDTLRNASFSTIFNFGDVKVYGLDMGLTYQFSRVVNFSVKYSWLGSDISEGHAGNDANKDDTVSADERSLNSPGHRGAAILSFQNLCKQKLYINLSARYVEQYDFYSGFQISTVGGAGRRGVVKGPRGTNYIKNFNWGPLGGFTTLDVNAGYKFNKMFSVGMGITNLFNTEQIEFVGSPSIGRLIMFELKVQLPNGKK